MAISRSTAIREVLRPWAIKILVGLPVLCGMYQFGCDQFDFPTLPQLWGMTGSQFPWWAWFFVALAGLVYGLFEYVRRLTTSIERPIQTEGQAQPNLESAVGQYAAPLEAVRNLQPIISRLQTMADEHRQAEVEQHRQNIFSLVEQARAMPRSTKGMMMGGFLAESKFPQIETELVNMGVDQTKISALVANRTEDVRVNPKYYLLEGDEDQIFQNGDERRRWSINSAALQAYEWIAKRFPNGLN